MMLSWNVMGRAAKSPSEDEHADTCRLYKTLKELRSVVCSYFKSFFSSEMKNVHLCSHFQKLLFIVMSCHSHIRITFTL